MNPLTETSARTKDLISLMWLYLLSASQRKYSREQTIIHVHFCNVSLNTSEYFRLQNFDMTFIEIQAHLQDANTSPICDKCCPRVK